MTTTRTAPEGAKPAKRHVSRKLLEAFASQDAGPLKMHEALTIAARALDDIANCKESDCAKYVAACDGLAVKALVDLDLLT